MRGCRVVVRVGGEGEGRDGAEAVAVLQAWLAGLVLRE